MSIIVSVACHLECLQQCNYQLTLKSLAITDLIAVVKMFQINIIASIYTNHRRLQSDNKVKSV